MLRALAPTRMNESLIYWRYLAERMLDRSKTEAAMPGGSLASAEEIFMQIVNWAIDGQVKAERI